MLLESNDTKISEKPRYLKYGVGAVILAALAGLVFFAQLQLRDSVAVVSKNNVVIATAVVESFSPAVRVLAEVVAADPVVVATQESGAVIEILKRNGDYVRTGEPIVRLENASLSREVADGQGRLIGQLGEIVGTEAQIATQIQTSENAVRDARYRLDSTERDLARQEALAARGFASDATLERLRGDRSYAREVMDAAALALNATRRDGAERLGRIASVRRSAEGLLAAQAGRMRALEVRAAASGRLTGLEVTVGTPVAAAEVLGRIEDETRLEILAQLPESRLADVEIGGFASGEINEQLIQFRILEIDPTVAQGQVRVRLAFADPPPEGLRLGQSIPLQVSVGVSREAVVLPFGAAVGPARAFVIDGDTARAQPVRLGERSGSRVEIVDGIVAGDEVVISVPSGIEKADALRLSDR